MTSSEFMKKIVQTLME